jgi:hypothetical protein
VIVADIIGEDLNEPMEFETVTSTFEVMQAFEAKPNTRRRRTPLAIPSGAAEPVKKTAEPSAGTKKPEAEIVDEEFVFEAPSNSDGIPRPDGVSRSQPVVARAKSDGAAKPTQTATPESKSVGDVVSSEVASPDSSGSMPPIQTEPERRNWVTSLLGRLSRTKPK